MKSQNDFDTEAAYQQYLTVCFAGIAMGGLLSLPHNGDLAPEEFTPEKVAEVSVETAEALVRELKRNTFA